MFRTIREIIYHRRHFIKRIIRYITWYLIDKGRLHKVMKKRKSRLVEPKHPYDYSKELAHPKGLEDLRKLKKEIEELEKEWEQNPPHPHDPKDDIVF